MTRSRNPSRPSRLSRASSSADAQTRSSPSRHPSFAPKSSSRVLAIAWATSPSGSNGEALFQFHQQQEVRLWYLIEWSGHVASSDYQNLQNEFGPKTVETYLQRPLKTSQETRSQGKLVNHVGTIRMIQRLINEPRHW